MTFISTVRNRKSVFSLLLLSVLSFTQTSCNVWSGLDDPSGDDQLLSAARGCFDRGDYTCALEYYQALSNSQADVKKSEQILVELARAGYMSVSDLVSSLGNGRGGGNSITNLANKIAGRGKTAGSDRTAIQSYYSQANTISDTNLKGYTKFLVAYSMLAQTLASIAGGDGLVTENDFSASSNCKNTTSGTCAGSADCGIGSSLLGSTASDGSLVDMLTATSWSGSPTIKKVVEAANGANTGLTEMGVSTSEGIFSTISFLATLPAGDNCIRRELLRTLFP